MNGKSPLILLVGIDLGARLVLGGALRVRGARVLVAHTAERALQTAREAPLDLVVLDQELEQSGPTGLAASMRSLLGEAKVVLLPSQGPKSNPEKGREGRASAAGLSWLKDHLDLISKALPGGLKRLPASSGRILCVDDDPAYLESLRRLLRRRGYQVECVLEAPRALEMFWHFHPDLVILDLMMPGMGGLDLAAELGRLSGGRIPVVFLTALDTDEVIYLGHESGARNVLAKSSDPEKLLDLVDSIAGRLDPPERELLEADI